MVIVQMERQVGMQYRKHKRPASSSNKPRRAQLQGEPRSARPHSFVSRCCSYIRLSIQEQCVLRISQAKYYKNVVFGKLTTTTQQTQQQEMLFHALKQQFRRCCFQKTKQQLFCVSFFEAAAKQQRHRNFVLPRCCFKHINNETCCVFF